jgi:hypothetical protein
MQAPLGRAAPGLRTAAVGALILFTLSMIGLTIYHSPLAAMLTTGARAAPQQAQEATIAWQSEIASRVPYTANSPWNTPIGASPVYDRTSKQMIDTIKHTSTSGVILSDTSRFTFPVYWADASTPDYDIPCVKWKCTQMHNGEVVRVDVLIDVPIPDGAVPSAGTDRQMIIVDTVTGDEYGLFHAERHSDGSWSADNAYQYNILNGDAATPGFGSRGAGVPYLAGLIRPWEIRAGEIKHALAFAYENTQAEKCVWPATQTDGESTMPFAMPEGARIQLDPALTDADFDAMGLTPTGKIVARALQQYGMFLIDTGGSPKIMAENLSDNRLYPLSWDDPELLYTEQVIAAIPYTEFHVLALPSGYHSGGVPTFGNCVK